MHVACPSCAAEYNVPEAVLGTVARPMRCARCQHVWTPAPAAPDVPSRAAQPPFPIQIEPASRALVTTEPVAAESRLLAPEPRHRRALGPAWAASAFIIIAVALGAVAQREAVMAAWPPAARAYAALGLR